MCIQWCCKHCTDKLTLLAHCWARERCNDYFIARSKNKSTTACPNGPWELRRAYHRHPYRGPQTCDECKKAGRKEKKLVRSARRNANVAMGRQREYAGATPLGELDIPQRFNRSTQAPFGSGTVDAMKARRQSFDAAIEHPTSHDLGREWTRSLPTFSSVDPQSRAWHVTLQSAPNRGRLLPKEYADQIRTNVAEKASRGLYQQANHHSMSSIHERNETLPHGARRFIPCHPDSAFKQQRRRQESSLAANQDFRRNHDSTSAGNMDRRNVIPAEEESSQIMYHQHRLPYNIRSERISENNQCTGRGNEPSRNSDHEARRYPTSYKFVSEKISENTYCTSRGSELSRSSDHEARRYPPSTKLASSSEATRIRPWDL